MDSTPSSQLSDLFGVLQPGSPRRVAACSKTRTPIGLRSGRAPGRERSRSCCGMSSRSKPWVESHIPRGRSLTRDVFEVAADAFETRCMVAKDSVAGEAHAECSVDFIGIILADAVEDHSDEAAHLSAQFDDEAHIVFELKEPPIPEESQDELVEESGDVIAAEVASACGDYPDSELVEDAHNFGHFEPSQGSLFNDYMSNMFEAAFSGGVLEFFGSVGSENLPGFEVVDVAQLPEAASIEPCSRPSFRKRLRPRELPPQAEEFPMDCLPSTPVCLSAGNAPTLEHWAEEMQGEALAEEICKHNFPRLEDVKKEAPLDSSLVPVAPSMPKPEGRPGSRHRPVQKTTQDPQQPLRPRTPRQTPHTHHAAMDACQPEPCAWPSAVATFATPTPPSAPPPRGKASRPQICFTQPAQGTVTYVPALLKEKASRQVMSPWAMSETSPHTFTAALSQTLKLDTDGAHAGLAPKSAMEMDLGEEAAVGIMDALPNQSISMSCVSKPLPHILQSSWGRVATPRRAHDVV